MYFHGVHLWQDNSRSSKTSPDNVNQPIALVKTATCGFFFRAFACSSHFTSRHGQAPLSAVAHRSQHPGIINIFCATDRNTQYANTDTAVVLRPFCPTAQQSIASHPRLCPKKFSPAGQFSIEQKTRPALPCSSHEDCARQSGPL